MDVDCVCSMVVADSVDNSGCETVLEVSVDSKFVNIDVRSAVDIVRVEGTVDTMVSVCVDKVGDDSVPAAFVAELVVS